MIFECSYISAALAVGVAAISGCAGAQGGIPTSMGSSTAANAAAGKVPSFKTNFGGFFQVVGGKPPSNVVISGTSIGVDSTGDSHGTFTQTVIFSSNPNQIKKGKFTFAWDDGSTLSGRYSGTATPPDSNGYTNGSGRFTVTKGTGRFADDHGRTGTFTVSAQIFPSGSSPAGIVNTTFQGQL